MGINSIKNKDLNGFKKVDDIGVINGAENGNFVTQVFTEFRAQEFLINLFNCYFQPMLPMP